MILSAGEVDSTEKLLERESRLRGFPLVVWRMKPGFNISTSLEICRWALSQNFQIMHSHGYKFNVLIGIWPFYLRKIPLITTLHGYVSGKRFTKTWVYESLDRFILWKMNQIVVVSESMKGQVPWMRLNSGRTRVVPNGVCINRIREETKLQLPKEITDFIETHRPLVLGVGRLSPEKGFDRLINAFSRVRERFPSAGLLIIGEGKRRPDLEALAIKHELGEAVFLPGYVDRVPAVMKRADVFCMPSLTEGLPISLLEAMTLDVPIVACNVGEIPSVLGQGAGGRLIQYEGPKSLADAIVTTLTDVDTTSECTKWSEQRVERDYSGRSMVERYIDVYQRALA